MKYLICRDNPIKLILDRGLILFKNSFNFVQLIMLESFGINRNEIYIYQSIRIRLCACPMRYSIFNFFAIQF